MPMNPVVHFEMPYEDRDRAVGFYAKAFGWKSQKFGEEMGNYVLVQTDESDEKGMLLKTNRINGGLYPKPDDPMGQSPSVVIAVDDIADAMKKVGEAGGKVLGEPVDIPTVGKYVGFLDTEGNRVRLLEPVEKM